MPITVLSVCSTCTVLYCTVLYCALHYTTLYYTDYIIHSLLTHLEVILGHHSSHPGCSEVYPTHTPPRHLILFIARPALLILAPSEWRVQGQQVGCGVLEQQSECRVSRIVLYCVRWFVYHATALYLPSYYHHSTPVPSLLLPSLNVFSTRRRSFSLLFSPPPLFSPFPPLLSPLLPPTNLLSASIAPSPSRILADRQACHAVDQPVWPPKTRDEWGQTAEDISVFVKIIEGR